VCRSFRSPQKLFCTAARSNQEIVSCIYNSLQNLLWLEIGHQNWWNQNVYFVSVFSNSPSFVNSMQNTKFCLLPQIVMICLVQILRMKPKNLTLSRLLWFW